MGKKLLDAKNAILFWGFTIFSAVILLRNSSLPIINDSLDIFIKPQDGDPILLSLSTSYLVSVIFYIIVVHGPEVERKKSAMILAKSRLIIIADQMFIDINYILKELKIEKDLDKCEKADFIDLEKRGLVSKGMNFYYQLYYNNKYGSNIHTNINEIDSFYNSRDVILNNINEILNLPNISYVDCELLEILTMIKDNWFFRGIDSYKKIPGCSVGNIYEGFYDFCKLFLRLEIHKEHSDIRFEQDRTKVPNEAIAKSEDIEISKK